MCHPLLLSMVGQVLDCPLTSFPAMDKFIPLVLPVRMKRFNYAVCVPSTVQMLYYFPLLIRNEGGLPYMIQEVAISSNGLDSSKASPFCSPLTDKTADQSNSLYFSRGFAKSEIVSHNPTAKF